MSLPPDLYLFVGRAGGAEAVICLEDPAGGAGRESLPEILRGPLVLGDYATARDILPLVRRYARATGIPVRLVRYRPVSVLKEIVP